MAIIGTLPSRFSDKNLTTLQRVPDTSMQNYLYFRPLATFKIMRHLKGCIGLHRNNLTKTRTKWR